MYMATRMMIERRTRVFNSRRVERRPRTAMLERLDEGTSRWRGGDRNK